MTSQTPRRANVETTFHESVVDSLSRRRNNSNNAMSGINSGTGATNNDVGSIETSSVQDSQSLPVEETQQWQTQTQEQSSGLPPPQPMRRSSSLLLDGNQGSSIIPSNNTSQMFASRPLVRRRSSLFDNLPSRSSGGGGGGATLGGSISLLAVPETNPPPTFFFQRLSQSSTLLGDDDNNNDAEDGSRADDLRTNNKNDNHHHLRPTYLSNITTTPTKKTSRSSLFGAVMEKFGNRPSGREEDDAREVTNTTTTTAASSSSSPLGFKSPSGRTIRNFMNRIASPFRFPSPRRGEAGGGGGGAGGGVKRRLSLAMLASSSTSDPTQPSLQTTSTATSPRRKRARTSISTNNNNNASTMVATSTSPFLLSANNPPPDGTSSLLSASSLHDDDNWREASIQHGQAEILDWYLPCSATTRLELECHPAQALTHLLNCREWNETLLYWTYSSPSPTLSQRTAGDGGNANYPGPAKSMDITKTTAGDFVATGNKGDIVGIKSNSTDTMASSAIQKAVTDRDPSIDLANRLIRTVRQDPNGASSRPAGRGMTAVADPMPISRDALTSRREWQQSFRSLYFHWYQQIQSEQNISTAILDYYFYCVTKDHVALFRVDNLANKALPRVLVSSAGESFLEDLRAVKVESMTVLKEPNPSKHLLSDTNLSNKGNPMSPTVKADLDALRKAQHFGEVAGADISIKMKTSKSEKPTSEESSKLAITLSGYDDVAAFFEVYYNRFGQTHDDIASEDPTTLHRCLPDIFAPKELGPFLHGTMKSLQAFPVRPKGSDTNVGNATIRGPVILPSVTRRLIALAVTKLSAIHPTGKERTESTPFSPTLPPNEDAAGSCYVVLHATDDEKSTLDTVKSLQSKKRSTKYATTMFNGIETNKTRKDMDSRLDESTTTISECRSGTTLQLIVWDVSRSTVAACKMGDPS